MCVGYYSKINRKISKVRFMIYHRVIIQLSHLYKSGCLSLYFSTSDHTLPAFSWMYVEIHFQNTRWHWVQDLRLLF